MILRKKQKAYEAEFEELYQKYKTYTQASKEKFYMLYRMVKYIINNNIKGDLVEVGVWKGGCCMLMADLLRKYNKNNRVVLIDTFTGMTEPTEWDYADYLPKGKIIKKWENDLYWNLCHLRDVKENMALTENENLYFIQGDVSEIYLTDVEKICLLRIDVDFYEPTKSALEKLYKEVVSGGVIIIDDYNDYYGCRKAVDEFFKNDLLIWGESGVVVVR